MNTLKSWILVLCMSFLSLTLVNGDDDDWNDCRFVNNQWIGDCDDFELATGWIIAIVVLSLIFTIGVPILCCFFCACLCFRGRRKNSPGQIHHHVVVPTNQLYQNQVDGNVNLAYQPQQPYPAQQQYGFTPQQLPPSYSTPGMTPATQPQPNHTD